MVLIDVPELLSRIQPFGRRRYDNLITWCYSVIIDRDHSLSEFISDVKNACAANGATFDIFKSNPAGFNTEITTIVVNAKNKPGFGRIAMQIYDITDKEWHKYPMYYLENHSYSFVLYDVDVDSDWTYINSATWALDRYGAKSTFAVSAKYFFEDIYENICRKHHIDVDESNGLDEFFKEF